jgi:hypothetical protein
MRQYRDEHPLIFQPYPHFQMQLDFQLHPQKHGHTIQRVHTGCWRHGKVRAAVRLFGSELEVRAKLIDEGSQAETNNLLLNYGFRCSTREISPSEDSL